jgi:hypothetical protein
MYTKKAKFKMKLATFTRSFETRRGIVNAVCKGIATAECDDFLEIDHYMYIPKEHVLEIIEL